MTLQPIAKRQGATSTVRKRDRSGGFTYQKGSVASLNGTTKEMSPEQKQEMEKKKRIQEKIAEFRLIRF